MRTDYITLDKSLLAINIPFTGCNALMRIVGRQYRPEHVLLSYLPTVGDVLKKIYTLPEELRHMPRAYMAHMPYGLHRFLKRESKYIVFIRDPVQRAVAEFNYIHGNSAHPLHGKAVALGMERFISEGNLFDNAQSRALCGIRHEDFDSLKDSAVKACMDNIVKRFIAAAPYEKFDEAILMIANGLGWKAPFYTNEDMGVEHNVSEPHAHISEIIKSQNPLDCKLYDLATAHFAGMLKQQGAEFEKKVEIFRSLNSSLDGFRKAGEEAFASGNMHEALSSFKRAISIAPDFALALNDIGVLHWQNGEFKLAVDYLLQAVSFDPFYEDARHNLADSLDASKHAGLELSISMPGMPDALWSEHERRPIVKTPMLLPKETRLFFIAGSMKSGTTWLMHALNAHADICCRGEMHPIEHLSMFKPYPCTQAPRLYPTLQQEAESSATLKHWYMMKNNEWSRPFRGPEQKVRALWDLNREYVRYFYEWAITRYFEAEGGGVPVFIGDKSPSHTKQTAMRLNYYFGDYKPVLIHIVRDPRDVAVSDWFHMRRLQREGDFVFSQPFLDDDDRDACIRLLENPDSPSIDGKGLFRYEDFLEGLLKNWVDVNDSLMRDGPRLFGDRYVLVRYEDMKQDFHSSLKEVLAVLGAGSGYEVIDGLMQSSDPLRMKDRPGVFRKGATGDWKIHFNENDIEVYENTAMPFARKLGYE